MGPLIGNLVLGRVAKTEKDGVKKISRFSLRLVDWRYLVCDRTLNCTFLMATYFVGPICHSREGEVVAVPTTSGYVK
jgi:hypothetical protein